LPPNRTKARADPSFRFPSKGSDIIVIAAQRPAFASALADANIFTDLDKQPAGHASLAIDELQPPRFLSGESEALTDVETLRKRIGLATQP